MSTDFEVGDSIIMMVDAPYSLTKNGAKGIITNLFVDSVRVEFETATLFPQSWYQIKQKTDSFLVSTHHCILVDKKTPQTQLQKIEAKIKQLDDAYLLRRKQKRTAQCVSQ